MPAFTASVALVSLLAVPVAGAQRGGGLRAPSGVAISPDGTTVAWAAGTREGSQIHITDAAGLDPAKDKIVAPNGTTNCSNSSPVWSPDSKLLAYTSTCTAKEEKPGQAQIFVWSKATGESRQLTHVTGLFKQAAFSPNGEKLAFLFVENASRSAGALDAMKPWAGVIGEDNLEIQGVYAVNVADGKGDWLVPATPQMYTFEFDWAPGSKEIAFIGAAAPGENNWWVANLYTISMGEKTPRVLFNPSSTQTALKGLQIAVPRFSPDGKKIAFIGGLMSDQGSTGGDLWVLDAKGGAPVDITPGIDGTPTFIAWTGNDTLGFTEDRRGHMLLADVDARSKKIDASTDLGTVQLSGGAIKNAITVSHTGTLAFVKSGFDVAPEIYVGGFGSLKQYSHLNDGVPARNTARIESIEWKNDSFDVQGWLSYPTNYDASKKYPMIVTVHGGPSASAFPRGAQWADLGYFEFQPNPRGSFGQGEAFTAANKKDFGYGDLRDILAGVDAVEQKVSVDDHRLGLTGWSYGGFMSMFAETQTTRFAAIVAGAGISNWKSYYGENSIDQWMVPFFGATVYDDPAVYAKSSAIEFIKKSKTPMLIIVGDRDGECPAPQSFEMWHALRAEGVKTELVIYPNEGHGFRDPAHIADRAKRTQQWFTDNMPAGGSATKGAKQGE